MSQIQTASPGRGCVRERSSKFLGASVIALIFSSFLQPVSAETELNQGSNVVVQWNSVMLQAIRDTNPGPPIVARALAITHTCMYDAWAAYDEFATGTQWRRPLRAPLSQRTQSNKIEAVSYAAYRAATDLVPSEKAAFDSLMLTLGYDPEKEATSGSPAALGTQACDSVLMRRHHDGANQLGDLSPGSYSDYTGYMPVNRGDEILDLNRWQPLVISDSVGGLITQSFLCPHWGNVEPFSFRNPRQFKLAKPAQYGSSEFVEQAREVVSYSANLTDAQKLSAEYWADGPHSETPPGHWNLLAQFLSHRDKHSIDEDVKMFFALNNALLDASIFAWWAKVEYDTSRPITVINNLFEGEVIDTWAGPYLGRGEILGEDWRPYQAADFVTPPFAEYISGHSTFSAAAAEVLRSFTGSNVFGYSVKFEAGSSGYEPGLVPQFDTTLSWATFSDAADDAGLSRLYGGIHFRAGDLEGRRVGKEIGSHVWRKSVRLFGEDKLKSIQK